MSKKYDVSFDGWAGWGVTVEVEDDDPRLEYQGPEEIAIELAFEHKPYLCAQCSGWGKKSYLEIADDWDDGTVEEVVE